MLVKMTKVEIVGPQKHFTAAVDILYSLGIMHLEGLSDSVSHRNVPVNDIALSPKELESRKTLQELYSRVNGLLLILPGAGFDRSRAQGGGGGRHRVGAAGSGRSERNIRSLSERKVALEEKIAVVTKYQRVLEVFAPLVGGIKGTKNFEMTGLTVHRDQRQVIPLLKAELQRITKGEFELFSQDIDKDTTTVLILYRKDHADAVNNLLFQRQISEIALPSDLRDRPFHEALLSLHALRETLPRDLEVVVADLQALAGKHRARIEVARDTILDALSKFQAYQKFGSTRYTFVICGWVPADGLAGLTERFARAFRDDVIINRLEMKEEEMDRVPVALSNSGPLRPFEVLLSLLQLPKYGAIDPTPFLAALLPALLRADARGHRVRARDRPGARPGGASASGGRTRWCGAGDGLRGLVPLRNRIRLHLRRVLRRPRSPSPPAQADLARAARAEALIASSSSSVGSGCFHVVLGLILGIVKAVREKSTAPASWHKVGQAMALAGSVLLVGGRPSCPRPEC